jgi:hypothetical protein
MMSRALRESSSLDMLALLAVFRGGLVCRRFDYYLIGNCYP